MKIFSVRLTPKASSNRIGEVMSLPTGEEQLRVYVTAVAEDSKANEAMIRLLAKHFGVAPSQLCIIKGATCRNKIIKILG
jgi:hypothetical protein